MSGCLPLDKDSDKHHSTVTGLDAPNPDALLSSSATYNLQMDPMGMVRHRAEVCQSLFSRCLSHPLFSELDWFENRQGEFNLWAASLKVISSGRPSLDYRLRDRPEVQELICDLLDGLSEALVSLLQPVASELEKENDDESTDEMDSIFSAFSSDGEDAASLPSIGKADGLFSEQMFNIKTILGQLARISTAIRRSGANYRYQKADALLDEESFKDFKRELTVIVLMGSIEARTEEPADNFDITAQITDSSRLTAIQNRLIHANIVRRNRIKFATRSMQRPEKAKLQQPQLKFISLPDIPVELPSQSLSKAVSDKPVTSSQAPSIVATSVVQTATDIGSQFKWEQATDSKMQSPSVMTKVTRTGAAQDYPACPKPVLDDILQCPYCADILPTSYSKQVSRWKGHVAQDVLPHICIHADCQTPDKMYLTSDELLKHMLSQHGVVRWVCDHCATKSAADETFIFSSFEDWEGHMRRGHASVSTASQLLSLSKVSQRRMLEPQKCPLCGYAAEHSSSTLDDHITKHLHGFALRCLPWSTGDDDADSVNAKSADASHSSDATDEDSVVDGEESSYLNTTESDSPDRLCELLIRTSNRVIFGKQVPLNSSYVERLKNMVELLIRHQSFLEAQAKSIAETFRLDRDESYPMQLSSLESVPPSTSQSSQNSNRLAGNLRFYPDPSGSHASLPSPAERLSEAVTSHVLKITRILYQTNQQWGVNASVELEPHATSPFKTYRNMMLRSSFARTFPSGDLGEANMYTQIELRWNGLTNVQKDEFVVRMARETDQIAAYLASNNEETQNILEDELTALGDVMSEVANNQRTQSTPTLMKIDVEEIKRFEVTEVYSHPDAKVDIVLVHGLNGDPRRTWQSQKGTFWPSELLPVSLKSAHARVLVYGYNADVYAFGSSRPTTDMIHQHAQTLLQNLALERNSEEVGEHPIIFVAHSLGGILVKRALELAAHLPVTGSNVELRSIFVSTYAIMFLGTPHIRSDSAGFGSVLERMVSALLPRKILESASQQAKLLQSNVETLQNINIHFLDIIDKFKICMVHESVLTDLNGTKTIIVDPLSAGPLLPDVTYFGIESSHAGMSKFDSKNSPGYLNVSATLRSWSQEAPSAIEQRWEQEKKNRVTLRRATANELLHAFESPKNSPTDSSPFQMVSSMVAQEHEAPYFIKYFIKPSGFRPNSVFVGREVELQQLHRLLFDHKRRAEGTSAVLIQSMPGGGKTHLARQYVYDHKDDFPGGIFWLCAKSESELSAGFWDIARAAALIDTSTGDHDSGTTISPFIIRVRNWFSRRQDWLLVLDGIHFDEAMTKFLPDSKNTSIIFTSTEKVADGDHHYLNPQVMRLPLLSAREAQMLLLLELDKKEPFGKDELRYSMELVQAMGFLPVVIHTMAQRVKSTEEPLSKFAKSYSSERRLRGLGAYIEVVNSLKQLGASEALNLMYLLCFFGENIPVEMIPLGLKALDIDVRTADPVIGKTLNNSFKILSSFALIDRSERDRSDDNASIISRDRDELVPDVDTIKLHSVVQEFFIDTLRTEGILPLCLSRAIALFCMSFYTADEKIGSKTDYGHVEDYRIYEIHGKTLERHLTKFQNISKDLDQRHLQDENRTRLNTTLIEIGYQIRRRTLDTPSSMKGGWSNNFQSSVFDRTNSGSTEPNSPDMFPGPGISGVSTWGVEPVDTMQGLESPMNIARDLEQFPPHQSQPLYPLQLPYPEGDGGYDSDGDRATPRRRHTSAAKRELRPNSANARHNNPPPYPFTEPAYPSDEGDYTGERMARGALSMPNFPEEMHDPMPGRQPLGYAEWQRAQSARKDTPSLASLDQATGDGTARRSLLAKQSKYRDSAGAFRSMSSIDPRISTETVSGYLQKGDPLPISRGQLTGLSAAEASLANLNMVNPAPGRSGGPISWGRTAEARRSPGLGIGKNLKAPATAVVTKDNATSDIRPTSRG